MVLIQAVCHKTETHLKVSEPEGWFPPSQECCGVPTLQPAEGPAGMEPQQHLPHQGGHTTQEVHKYRNSVPREHRQPERQQHSSFPEPDTANLRIDTTEDPTEGSLSTPSDASAPFSSEKHWVAISQSRMHGKEEQQLVDAPLARGEPGTGQSCVNSPCTGCI